MKESIHKYSQVGAIQRMGCPQRDPMESLKAICEDGFFDAIGLKGYSDRNEEVKKLLEQSHLKVCYGTQPRLPGGKSNPNDLDEEGRRKAEATLIEAVDEVKYLGAKGIVSLAGKWQPEIKDQAYVQLLKTTRVACDYAAAKGIMVELEMFDHDMDKVTLIGPAPYAAEFVADMYTTHNDFGLLVDLSYLPATYETSGFVIRTLRSYIAHFHLGSAVVMKGRDGYGDLYPRFGHPNSVNDTLQLLDYPKVMKEEGLFDAENLYVLSMEVTLRPGEDEDTVLANTKGVPNRAWTLLEDST